MKKRAVVGLAAAVCAAVTANANGEDKYIRWENRVHRLRQLLGG